jgi:hypothetical protein
VLRPGAAIAVVGWTVPSTNQVQIRLYTINEKNQLLETPYDGKNWNFTWAITTGTVTDSGLGAIQWMVGTEVQIRVYFQNPGGIKEWAWTGSSWNAGANVPIYP